MKREFSESEHDMIKRLTNQSGNEYEKRKVSILMPTGEAFA